VAAVSARKSSLGEESLAMTNALRLAPRTGSSLRDFLSGPVLLADANPRSARIAHRLLQNSGCEVVACADGRAAFRQASACGPAVLVMDPELRGIHGLEILARLKRQPHPVPVVLTTRNECLREDVVVATYPRLVVLPKPYDRHDLVSAIQRCLATPGTAAAAIGPDDAFRSAIVHGPTAGVLRTPSLEVGVCARGSFRDTFFRVLTVDAQRSGLFVVEREVGASDTIPVFRELGRTLDEAAEKGASPGKVMRRADRCVRDAADGSLLAGMAIELDSGRRELALCRAGYHAPLAAAPGGSPAEVHLPFGSLLGAPLKSGAEPTFRTVRLPFPEDGALLLLSTGALLAVSRSIPDLGPSLFSGYLREHAGKRIPAALEALLGLLGALGVQGPGLDLLLMVVRRRRHGA
jgi:CheY-like chemotaxis protein